MCDQLARSLGCDFVAAAIHGDKSQGELDMILSQFKTEIFPVLVAINLVAQGLDNKDIRMVINYNFSTRGNNKVHWIGRTGQANATGLAHKFFFEHDRKEAKESIKVLEDANLKIP